MGLDRVQCGENPRACPRPSVWVGRHQRLRPFSDVDHDGTGLEQLEIARLNGRNLAKRLKGAIASGCLVPSSDQPFLIWDTRLLEYPAHPKVAHQPLCNGLYPRESTTSNHPSSPSFTAI